MIIAAYSVLLVLMKYKVDVITSSHLLAKRDVSEWTVFYDIFEIKAMHNGDEDYNFQGLK